VLPGKSRKSDYPTEEGDSNRSEVRANMTFLAKLSNKEIYFFKKWLLGWA
jgi:hypothetical protein